MNLRLPITFALAIGLVASLSGCGKSKVAQCNTLIDKMNATVETLNKAPDPKDDATAKAYADAMKKAAADVSTVEVEDAKLKEFRDTFAKSYTDSSTSLAAIAAAPGEPKPEDLEKMKAAKAQADKLTDQINAYCK